MPRFTEVAMIKRIKSRKIKRISNFRLRVSTPDTLNRGHYILILLIILNLRGSTAVDPLNRKTIKSINCQSLTPLIETTPVYGGAA